MAIEYTVVKRVLIANSLELGTKVLVLDTDDQWHSYFLPLSTGEIEDSRPFNYQIERTEDEKPISPPETN